MTERLQIGRGATHVERLVPQKFCSLLVPIDLSPSSDRVVGRVALLPLADDAQVSLLHVVPKTLSTRGQKRAQADAQRALEAEARSLEERLTKRVRVEVAVTRGAPAAEIAKRATVTSAEVIVMSRGGGRVFRDAFIGSTAERVIRSGQRPVLVVRLPPRGHYRRPALALDIDEAASGVIALLLRVIPRPRPTVEIIHAYDTPYGGMIYPSLSEEDAEEHREHYRQAALRGIEKRLAMALDEAHVAASDAPVWRAHVRYGSPRSVIKRAVKKGETDLLVLGTHGYAGIAHAFLGTVAGDVLREVACDVLVVPPRSAASGTG